MAAAANASGCAAEQVGGAVVLRRYGGGIVGVDVIGGYGFVELAEHLGGLGQAAFGLGA
jgi:hypothetical protein